MMNFEYFDKIESLLRTLRTQDRPAMEKTVEILHQAIKSGKTIYTFGASHAGILSEELYYRAGGLMLFNPIFGRELMLDTSPVTLTSCMERCPGYGTVLADKKANFQKGDVLIIHSVSGRNPVAIDLAQAAAAKGVTIVAITNVQYSKSVDSRHPSGLKLYQLADIVLDNHGDVGDACVEIAGLDRKVSPTSTVSSVVLMNAIVAELVRKLVTDGMKEPPVFCSANIDGGDERNSLLFEKYKTSIHYSH